MRQGLLGWTNAASYPVAIRSFDIQAGLSLFFFEGAFPSTRMKNQRNPHCKPAVLLHIENIALWLQFVRFRL